MRENVGPRDRTLRSLLGPAVILLGLARLGVRRGQIAALATLVAGVLVLESAITKTCPVNAAIGVKTP